MSGNNNMYTADHTLAPVLRPLPYDALASRRLGNASLGNHTPSTKVRSNKEASSSVGLRMSPSNNNHPLSAPNRQVHLPLLAQKTQHPGDPQRTLSNSPVCKIGQLASLTAAHRRRITYVAEQARQGAALRTARATYDVTATRRRRDEAASTVARLAREFKAVGSKSQRRPGNPGNNGNQTATSNALTTADVLRADINRGRARSGGAGALVERVRITRRAGGGDDCHGGNQGKAEGRWRNRPALPNITHARQ